MAALGRRDAQVLEARFHDDARARDLIPGHGNSQPVVLRSPAAHANQQVGPALGDELGVELRDRLRRRRAQGAVETMEVDHDHVA